MHDDKRVVRARTRRGAAVHIRVSNIAAREGEGHRRDHGSAPPPFPRALTQPTRAQTGFRGYRGKAALFASTLNTALAAPSVLLMDTGAHTVQECACARCGAYLGWRVARAHESSEKWKEGRFLLELALLAESAPDPDDLPTPVRLQPPTPVSEPPTPVSSAPPTALSSTPHATLRPLPLPVKLEEPAPLRPLPRPRSRPSSSDGLDDPVAALAERLGQNKGHRRSATDTPSSGAARGRPLGPRSLTPTLGARTLSAAYSQV